MSDRLCQAALLAVLILGAGGCGTSSSSPTTASTATNATTQAGTPTQPGGPTSSAAPAKTTRSNAARHRSSTSHRSSTAQTTSTARRTTTQASSTAAAPATTTATATVRTAPPPTPAGTAAAPAGLTQTTGYGTYELCASGCTGSVPAALRRPLHIPHVASGASCRASEGTGPVKPLGSAQLAVSPLIGSVWRGGRVTWSSASSYTGPVLIRGRQLGGAGAVGFGEGRVPYDELQLLAQGMSAPRAPGGGREWLSFTRVRSPGCYAYQVDGTSFSAVVVFRAEG